ncbi:hypothetical protein [Bacillus sp. SRB_8]|uniref:hypothetical protein n=1 Tax=unclassified Bacillus (in: firmicutes) TaxID=185979 RepID=UPI000DC3E7F9|nr:hypothetical protein [Bacillus sp. SRB_8]RAN71799.1 hypothetical protein B5P40_06805 [Bacillus sp. SRB_8]
MNYTIEKYNEVGRLTESFSEEGQDLLKDAELFSTGTHRGRTYTVDHLEALASSFNKEDMIPIQLDHSESVKDTLGFLESVSVVGNKLIGKLRIVEDSIKQRVQKGLAKKVSISFYTDKEGNPSRIREVSLVAFPQLKGAQLFYEQEQPLKYSPQEVYEAFSVTMEAIAQEEKSFNEEYKQYVKSLGIK